MRIPKEIEIVDLKRRLLGIWGLKVCSLKRIPRGAQSVNYAGIREDGVRFVLKLVPFARERQYRLLVDHLESVVSGLVVRELLPQVRFDVFGYHALLLEWCVGSIVPFDHLFDFLSPEDFVADYERFVSSIQGVHDLYPPFDYVGMTEAVRNSPVGTVLDDEFLIADYSVLKPIAVMHGDLQSDNLRFHDGRLSAVLDIEEFRWGTQVEDLARYVCCSAGHVPWYRPDRHRRLLANFARLIQATPHSEEEWVAALRGQLVKRMFRFVRDGKTGRLRRVKLKWHMAKCRKLIGVVREVKSK